MGAALLVVGIELLIGIGIGLIVTGSGCSLETLLFLTALRWQSWRDFFPTGF